MNLIFNINNNIMYPYIVCFCGHPVGDVYPMYVLMKKKLYLQYCADNKIKIDPTYAFMNTISLSTGHILDALCVKKDCCRKTLLGQTEFREYY